MKSGQIGIRIKIVKLLFSLKNVYKPNRIQFLKTPDFHFNCSVNFQKLELPYLFNNRYLLLSKLGAGGMGTVYRAEDKKLGKDIALKVVSQDISNEYIVRFQNEAKTIAKLNHPNIVDVFDFGFFESDESQLFIAMEFVNGESLAQIIEKNERLSYLDLVPIVVQILDGLSNAHNNDVLHRDIKPSNIMVNRNEKDDVTVKLVDFGLAKIAEDDQKLTQTGATIGSPYYISPEQVEGKAPDVRSDIYSLGCLMYKALTGRVPFAGKDAMETMSKHLNEAPLTFSEMVPGLVCPSELEKLVRHCLEKNPDQRISTVGQVKIEFKAIIDRLSQYGIPDSKNIKEQQKNYTGFFVVLTILAAVGVLLFVYKLFVRIEDEYKQKNEKIGESGEQIAKRQEKNKRFFKADVPIEETVHKFDRIENGKENLQDDIDEAISGTDQNGDTNRIVKFDLNDDVLRSADSPVPLRTYKMLPKASRLYKVFLKGSNVDDRAIDYISQCKRLLVLDISANEGISLEAFAKLKQIKTLQVLDVSAIGLDDRYLELISRFPSVTQLDISTNSGITNNGIRKLSRLASLEGMIVGNVGLPDIKDNTSVAELIEFVNAKKSINMLGLKIDFRKVKGWQKIAQLKPMKRISLTLAKGVNKDVLDHVLKIPNLAELALSESDVDCKDILLLNEHPNIKVLSLEKCYLTLDDLSILMKLKYIERLNISKNSHGLPKEAIKNMRFIPTLKELDARQTAMDGYYTLRDGKFYRVFDRKTHEMTYEL